MARRHVGIVPLGGMVALCAILLLAPVARSEITIVPKKYTISGKIGVAGVSLNGFPVSPIPTTDENGVYSVEVEYGWTGKVRPTKLGYNFQPSERAYPKVTSHQSDQDYTANLVTYTISGSVGEPGVKMNGFPTDVFSDQSGRYTATVDWGMSYTIVPEKTGFRFDPPSMAYNQVKQSFQQDYKASEVTFTISGSTNVAGVVMKGLPGDPTTGQDGRYSVKVRYGFSGTVTPTKGGCIFTPENRQYAMVQDEQPNHDYGVEILVYKISGSTGQPSVVMKGFPDEVQTDETGYYEATVPWGWNGKVTPDKGGWTFTPPVNEYKDVTASLDNQNYNGTEIYLTIEGSTGIGQVTLSGFPAGDIVSDEKGMYRAEVRYGWTGQVSLRKEGYEFTPADKTFVPVTQNLLKQDFKAEQMSFEISGGIQPALSGVRLTSKDLPSPIVVGADGSYSFKVPYNWSGTLVPAKAGYTFEPVEYAYSGVTLPLPNQNFLARVVQYAISGRILDKEGNPVPDILLVPEGTSPTESVMTDSTGAFEIKVDHGWNGKVTPQNEAWIFNPSVKTYSVVGGPMANQMISAEKKMLTISDVIKYGPDPIQDVQVTATPGDYKAKTDATGKFSIKVPYGWTGELSFFKEEFDISGTRAYTNVTENIDETAPPKPPTQQPPTQQPPTQQPPTQQPPTQQPPTQQPPTQQPPTQQPPTQQPPTQQPVTQQPPIPTIKQVLLERLDKIKAELDSLPVGDPRMVQLMNEYSQVQAMIEGKMPVDQRIGTQPTVRHDLSPLVPDVAMPMLLTTLKEISRLAGVGIAVDLTVKDEPIAMGAPSVQGLPITLALQQVLEGASKTYTFKMLPDGTYLVYHPITNMFPGSDLRMALEAIAMEAGVPIIPDPNVGGTTSVNIEAKPLEAALSMVLAGTPYVFQRMPDNYYLVADHSPESPAFPDISVTDYVRTNHILPQTIKELLPAPYLKYVQAQSPAADANDMGHLITVTAPKRLSGLILDMIRNLDKPRRQVLLDARVVVMERGNMLNLGVEWTFPTLQAGGFSDMAGNWKKGLQVGYSADQAFTSALMATLNLLEATDQADIVTHQQLVAEDGSQAQLRSIREEWFMMSDRQTGNDVFGFYSRAELQKVESGTILTITPYIGDSNEIKLKMSVEVSDSIPRGPDSDLPIVTRRQAKSAVTLKNGGTVAVAGLTENRNRNVEKRVPLLGSIPLIGSVFRNKDDQQSKREVAVFVTATLVGENAPVINGVRPSGVTNGVSMPRSIGSQPQPSGMTREDIADALNRTR